MKTLKLFSNLIFRVHPQNPNIVYTNAANGQVKKWDVRSLPARPTSIVLPDGFEPNFCVNRFAIDPHYSIVRYSLNLRANTGHKFFRTIDGCTNWENINYNVMQGSVNGIAVSPVTGKTYITSLNGLQVMLPPYVTRNTSYKAVPYTNNLLIDSYD